MLKQTLQINNIDDYLYYFIEKANEQSFEIRFPQVKERILQNCAASQIQKEHLFFQRKKY